MFHQFFKEYQTAFTTTIAQLDYEKIKHILEVLETSLIQEKNIFIIGNGGSSASASHWVCDFNKGISYQNRQIKSRVFALTDNIPVLTAYGNDVSYDAIFQEQLKNLASKGDILISLSVSGNSKNLVLAQNYARQQEITTISITRATENNLSSKADIALKIPSENYGIVEDVHMYVCHVITQFLAQS